ncbi:MAG: hypothetical protein PUE76_02205 [Bacteroides sp.]|nr:hypothetical protein [Bacteroides sp.]
MKRSNFWAKLATALITLSLAGGAFIVTSCGEDEKIETPDGGDDKPGDDKPGDDKPGDDKPGEETTTATVTLSTPNVDGTTVSWTGKLEVKGTGTVEAGVSYSESNKPNRVDDPDIVTVQKAGTPDASGNFTVTVTGLIKDHTYYYCSYYKIDGKYTFGDVIEFKTGGNVYEESADIDMSKAEDLSASETANCYIVTKAGTYKFKAVKGNDQSQTLAGSKAEILWESFGTEEMPAKGSLVNGICYKDGYVGFTTPSTYTKGNALVALKNADGTIIWSWHIWLTDQPAEHVYRNNAGTMMDRNLGATTGATSNTGSIGLHYQWGRKDPFPGSVEVDASATAACTGDVPKIVSCTSLTGTIEYAISHPATFITYNWDGAIGAGNSDWLYDAKEKVNGDYPVFEKERWTSSKTIYDPCPTGWRVPDGGSDGIWAKAGFSEKDCIHTTIPGYLIELADGSKTWYPAAGERNDIDGANKMTAGVWGNYWSCTARTTQFYCFRFSFDSQSPRFAPTASYFGSEGMSVRCQKIL